jgi:hypothetical protein
MNIWDMVNLIPITEWQQLSSVHCTNTFNSISGHDANKLSYNKYLGHVQFDPINKMITLIMIPIALTYLIQFQVMMLGELEYDDLYYPQDQTINLTINGSFASGTIDQETKSQFFPFTAHILVTVFVLLVSIIIMNLLFGLAVTDIQVLIGIEFACL